MQSVLKGHRRFWGFALLALGLLAAGTSSAREVVLRIGLPLSYQAQVQSPGDVRKRCEPLSGGESLCYRPAFGTDYQLLDWFLSGKVDGAVLSRLAIELVRRHHAAKFSSAPDQNVRAEFERGFLVRADLPHNGLILRRYRVSLRALRHGEALPDPKGKLDQLFHTILTTPDSGGAKIEVPSHLSPALPLLAAHASDWLEQNFRAQDAEAVRWRDKLADGLVERLQFSIFSQPGESRADESLKFAIAEERECAAAARQCLADREFTDLFIVRRRALPQALEPSKSDVEVAAGAEGKFLSDLDREAKRLRGADTPFARFVAGNYVFETFGWRSRYRFMITLDELHTILRRVEVRGAQPDDGIGLVLTGGGVKAAYQTKLIDHLYGTGYLRNVASAPDASESGPLPVKYVIGTSGGALLGIFVATIRDAKGLNLSDKLWKRHDEAGNAGPAITSSDVFPVLDLMRWLSLLYCVLIFALVCFVTRYLQFKDSEPPLAMRDGGGRFWHFSLPWLALLITTPWLMKYINGEHAAEHIPEIEGIFYFLFALIAIYSDNRLVAMQTRRAGGS